MIEIGFNAGWAYFKKPPSEKIKNIIASNLTWYSSNIAYQNSKTGRYRQSPYICIYNPDDPKEQFLTGLLPRVDGILRTHLPNEEIVYDCSIPTVDLLEIPLPDWAYSHQAEMVEAAAECKRGIFSSPTGSGKSCVMAFIAERIPKDATGIITVPTKGLLEKTHALLSSVLDEPVGRVGDSQEDWQRITVGIINSLSQKRYAHKNRLNNLSVLLMDECFPAGQLIDGKPIETIQVGDYVTSFNELTQQFEQKRVTYIFQKETPSLKRVLFGDRQIICTPNHPFLTRRGWVAAEYLTDKDEVLSNAFEDDVPHMRQRIHSGPNNVKEEVSRRQNHSLLDSLQEETYSLSYSSYMLRVWEKLRAFYKMAKESLPDGKQKASVLFERMFFSCSQKNSSTEHDKYEQEGSLSSDEAKQPYGKAGDKRKNVPNIKDYGAQAKGSWWEWQRNACDTEIAVRSVRERLERGVRIKDQCLQIQQPYEVSLSIQDRHCESGNQNSYRGGRGISYKSSQKGTGSKEGEFLNWVRVEAVEVYKPRSSSEPTPSAGSYKVFNLEVEDNHTYCVGGLVVHNCHRGASALYKDFATCCPNTDIRIGLTGTAFRPSGDDIVMEGVLGPIIYKVTEQELTRKNVIIEPKYVSVAHRHADRVYSDAYTVKVPCQESGRTKTQVVYPTHNGKPERDEVYTSCIVKDVERNKLIVELLEAFLSNPNRVGGALILIEKIDQGKLLAEMSGHQFISGSSSTKTRSKAINALTTREIEALIASNILNEGEDIKNLQLVIIGGGGSNQKTLVQQVGRVTRSYENKETGQKKEFAIVVDIEDIEPYYLHYNYKKRADAFACRYKNMQTGLSREQAIALLASMK